MGSRILSFDLDGVLIDTTSWAVRWMESQSPGLALDASAVHCWEYSQAFGLTRDANRQFWEDFFVAPMDVIPAAITSFTELRHRGYSMVITTARSPEQMGAIFPILGDFNISPDQVIHAPAAEKAGCLDQMGALAHVDDKWQTAADLGEIWHGSGRMSYLFSRAWNQSLDLMTNYRRINDFSEVLNDFQ